VIRVEAGGVVFEVEGVAFDKDGTLIDLDAAWGPAARRWVDIAGAGEIGLAQDLATELGLDLETGRLVTGGIFAVGTVGQLHETTLSVLSAHGLTEADAQLVASEARTTSAIAGDAANLVALGEVTSTFRALKDAGLRLAIVSSDNRVSIDAAVVALGIGDLVDAVVSGDEGLDPKPAPDALWEAARRMGVEPAAMLYVGDSWVDAAAGQAAGVVGTVLVGDAPPEARELAAVVVPAVDSLRVI
jgi:HAD superfamily hydrolase (TIGR01549 family)